MVDIRSAPEILRGISGVFLPRSTRSLVVLMWLASVVGGCAPPSDSTPAGESARVPAERVGADAGGRIFQRACIACHGAGLVGAPKLGDRQAWAPRIGQGREVLVQHAVDGFSGQTGVMPPKGGHSYLDEAEVSAAVDYMLQSVR